MKRWLVGSFLRLRLSETTASVEIAVLVHLLAGWVPAPVLALAQVSCVVGPCALASQLFPRE